VLGWPTRVVRLHGLAEPDLVREQRPPPHPVEHRLDCGDLVLVRDHVPQEGERDQVAEPRGQGERVAPAIEPIGGQRLLSPLGERREHVSVGGIRADRDAGDLARCGSPGEVERPLA
jgi:hypothetical protein